MPSFQKVRANKWCKFERVFSNNESEVRYIREMIFGKRGTRTYWELTTDPETMPDISTSFAIANLTGKTSQLKKTLGNLYGLRTWVEYGFRQCQQELGWTDYRLTDYQNIENWWEIIFSAYLMISLNTPAFLSLNSSQLEDNEIPRTTVDFSTHRQWNHQRGWKSAPPALRFPQRV